jgi:hypothetical protein
MMASPAGTVMAIAAARGVVRRDGHHAGSAAAPA